MGLYLMNVDKFPSVEHFFQASKFKCSNKPEYFADFTVNGKYGNVDAPTAMRKGSKVSSTLWVLYLMWTMEHVFDRHNERFHSVSIEQDYVFCQILNECRDRESRFSL